MRAVKHGALRAGTGFRDGFQPPASGAYDRRVDPITARRVLRIYPDAPLTVELVERAYSEEYWARHPSRYQDAGQRREAEQWAASLAAARQALLQELGTTAAAPDAASAPHPRRGLSGGAIAGIAVGAAALLALVGFGIFGAVNLVTQAASTAEQAIEEGIEDATGGDGTEFADVERYEAAETFYVFPAALELYMDGRYDAECSLEFVEGCWQTALFTEADCDTLQVELAFSNEANAPLPDHRSTIEIDGVVAGEATPVVFGHDDYAYGWINEVTCLGTTN